MRRQWVVSTDTERACPPGWTRENIGPPAILDFHPDLLVHRFANEHWRAWLVGHGLLEPESRLPTDDDLPIDSSEPTIVRFANRLAGVYALVISHRSGVDVYTDPAGLMTTYFSDRSAASSPSLLLTGDEDAGRLQMIDPVAGWIPGDRTPFPGVRYLQGNHRLRLGGNPVRVWPAPDGAPLACRNHDEIDALVREAGEQIASQASAVLARSDRVRVSLSGGYDSRVVAGAFGAALGRAPDADIECFTIATSASNPDLQIAQRVASACGLAHKHMLTPSADADNPYSDEYGRITGDLVFRNRSSVLPALAEYAAGSTTHANGNLGAIGKRFYTWPATTTHAVHRAIQSGFSRRISRETRDALSRWTHGLPMSLPELHQVLLYAEHRGGRWMGPGDQGTALLMHAWTPFCSRRLILDAVTFRLSTDAEHRDFLEELAVTIQPSLAGVPYYSGRKSVLSMWTPWYLKSIPRKIKGMMHNLRS